MYRLLNVSKLACFAPPTSACALLNRLDGDVRGRRWTLHGVPLLRDGFHRWAFFVFPIGPLRVVDICVEAGSNTRLIVKGLFWPLYVHYGYLT